jgi:hypothetical protein
VLITISVLLAWPWSQERINWCQRVDAELRSPVADRRGDQLANRERNPAASTDPGAGGMQLHTS